MFITQWPIGAGAAAAAAGVTGITITEALHVSSRSGQKVKVDIFSAYLQTNRQLE